MVVFNNPSIKTILKVIEESYEDTFSEDAIPDFLECIGERLKEVYKTIFEQNVRFAGCDLNQLPPGVYAVRCTEHMDADELLEITEVLQDFVEVAGDGYKFLVMPHAFLLKRIPENMTTDEVRKLEEWLGFFSYPCKPRGE